VERVKSVWQRRFFGKRGSHYASPRATLAFLFTDIEGSTALLQRVGESTYASLLAQHHDLIRSAVRAREGAELDNAGDGFFIVFTSPRSAVAAVIEAQRALESQKWPGGERVRVRMGLHAGEAS
jgi:class 3 adenylate cyclase